MNDSPHAHSSTPKSQASTPTTKEKTPQLPFWVAVFCAVLVPLWIIYSRPAKLSAPEPTELEDQIMPTGGEVISSFESGDPQWETVKVLLNNGEIDQIIEEGSNTYSFFTKGGQSYTISNLSQTELGETIEKCGEACETIILSQP